MHWGGEMSFTFVRGFLGVGLVIASTLPACSSGLANGGGGVCCPVADDFCCGGDTGGWAQSADQCPAAGSCDGWMYGGTDSHGCAFIKTGQGPGAVCCGCQTLDSGPDGEAGGGDVNDAGDANDAKWDQAADAPEETNPADGGGVCCPVASDFCCGGDTGGWAPSASQCPSTNGACDGWMYEGTDSHGCTFIRTGQGPGAVCCGCPNEAGAGG